MKENKKKENRDKRTIREIVSINKMAMVNPLL